MDSLFDNGSLRPLADKIRPSSLAEVAGQEHLLADDAPLGRLIKSGTMEEVKGDASLEEVFLDLEEAG